MNSMTTYNAHRFPWKWWLADLTKLEKNGLTVFSCFSCGGGSSMGYKLAGYTVKGCCEIDPQMMKIYRHNLNPALSYEMDVRDLPTPERVKEIGDVDILDGSPPCSVFSIAGKREAGWGVEKQFREGQKKQRLDDLFFAFIDVAKAIKPKVIVAENVKGILLGDAKGYAGRIVYNMDKIGYDVQVVLMNSVQMGVPQERERVFFIGARKDLELPRLRFEHIAEPPIPFGAVRLSEPGDPVGETKAGQMLKQRQPGDRSLSAVYARISGTGKRSWFSHFIAGDARPAMTVAAAGIYYRDCDGTYWNGDDFRNVQTFPQDYDFMDAKPQYVCGMSVPPVMMAQIAKEIELQWLKPKGG